MTPGRAAVALVVAGVVLRVLQYASGRSLWLDESFLWINLDRRSFTGLTGPLDLSQGAPIPFLLGEKAVVELFGDSVWALRAIPLVAGCAALVVSAVLARRILPPWDATLAVGLLAVGQALVYQSSELKQYSTDVLVAACLLLLLTWAAARPPVPAETAALAAGGAAALWLSDPAVFILAAAAVVLLADAALARDRPRLVRAGAVAAAWLASFVALYLVHVRDLTAVRSRATGGAAEPSLGDPHATLDAVTRALAAPWVGGDRERLVASVLVVAGLAVLWRAGRARDAALLGGPALLLVAAALAHRYPLGGARFALFLAPALAITAAAALGAAWRGARAGGAAWAIPVGAVLLVAVAVLAEGGVRSARTPITREEIGPVLERLAAARRPGDVIYLYYAGQYAYAYHAPRAGLPAPPRAAIQPDDGSAWGRAHPAVVADAPGLVVGRPADDVEAVARDVDRVRAVPRVWIVVSHDRVRGSRDEGDLLLRRARAHARPVRWIREPGAFAVLMEAR